MKPLALLLFSLPCAMSPIQAPPIQDLLKKSPQHAHLFRRVGTWDAVIVVRDPNGKPVETKGVSIVRKHAEYHLVEEFTGEMMGLPFVGLGVTSWCPVRKEYLTTWTDSMTPAPMLLRGNYDAAKRELAMTGSCFGPSGTLEPVRAITTFQNETHLTWALLGDGPESKQSELIHIRYTRRS